MSIGTDTRAAEILADILTDANRMTPEQIRDIIEDAGLHGRADDLEDTAIGNYVAHHALLAGVAPALYSIVMGRTLYLVHTRTQTVLASADITGTLHELDDLIADDDELGYPLGFGHLHDPDELDPEPLGAADLAETFGSAPVTDAETHFLDSIA